MSSHGVDARDNTFYRVGRDNYNNYNNYHPPPRGEKTPPPLSFNNAPTGLLSAQFTGRKDELEHLRATLEVRFDGYPTRLALHGMPGLGKTQLALQYAATSYKESRYSVVFWISGTTIEKLNQGFAKLLYLVGHPDCHHTEQSTRLTAAQRWLEDPDNVKWLLIIDNVSSEAVPFLRDHLPNHNPHGSILFTTRTSSIADTMAIAGGQQHQTYELQPFDLQHSAELLLKASELDNGLITSESPLVNSAKNVAKCVGCLPLALVQAASFVKQSHRSLDCLLVLYQSKHKYDLISWENNLSSYEQSSVVATFASQLENLAHESPDTSNLLMVLSFYHPESIPLKMILDGADDALHTKNSVSCPVFPITIDKSSRPWKFRRSWLKLKWSKSADHPTEANNPKLLSNSLVKSLFTLVLSPVHLHSAIRQLQDLSLIRYQHIPNASTSLLHIHSLIQVIVQRNVERGGLYGTWFDTALAIACNAFERVEDSSSYTCWPDCAALTPHIQSLTVHDAAYSRGKHDLIHANVQVARYLSSQGRYNEAEVLYIGAVAGYDKLHGPQHCDTLQAIHNLATVYLSQGRYSEAETLFQEALKDREALLGPDHLDTLRTMVNLATAYDFQGRYHEAKNLYNQALNGRIKVLGLQHSETLAIMQNLAIVHKSLGQFVEATHLSSQALTGYEHLMGPEHPETLKMMQNHAIVYRLQGQHDKSETLYARVLAIEERLLGPEHPDTLRTVHNLATAFQSQKRYDEAERFYDRALEAREKVLGHEHPDTLRTVQGLALVYREQGRYTEAENLCQRSLKGREKTVGHEHPSTLLTVHTLATIHLLQGRHSDAETLLKRALEGRVNVLGSKHAHTVETVEYLVSCLREQGLVDEANSLREEFVHTPNLSTPRED